MVDKGADKMARPRNRCKDHPLVYWLGIAHKASFKNEAFLLYS